VNITIYDIKGRLVSTLLNKSYQAGIHKVEFDGTNLANGIYFVRARILSSAKLAGQHIFTKKIMLLK